MLVGFDTEFGYTVVRRIGGNLVPDVSSGGRPVCACLAFDDGRELSFTNDWGRLEQMINDPQHTVAVHGAHAERSFCGMVGIRFPEPHVDTLLRSVLLAHATTFEPVRGAYYQAGLGAVTARFGIPFIGAGEKDVIRDSILQGRHQEEFGMPAVLDYCLGDARACLRLVQSLGEAVARTCGPHAERNLTELYQPYARVMADVAARGIRFDAEAWSRLMELAPRYRERHLRVMRANGYDHDGPGLGDVAFARMLARTGLAGTWPRTPADAFRTREADLKDRRHLHPAIRATHQLLQFDNLMGQRLGDRVDRDGRLRCGILPFAQRSGRNSTVRPNLMGIPGDLRPLLLPDEGHVWVHFDYSQQEPGVAAYLREDPGLLADFRDGDVYTNTGRRMGLVRDGMSPADVRAVRSGVIKGLMLSIIYGKSAGGIARDLPCRPHDAKIHLIRFEAAYPRLFRWLRSYVSQSMQRGWAENVIGFRAAFDVRDPTQQGHVARSCQNFPIQASAAACFQITGVHLADFGADIRLPMHDAYLLQVPDDPRAIANVKEQIKAATEAATKQLFPDLVVKQDTEVLARFAKDGDEQSLDRLIKSLEQEEELCEVS
jgi:DNA polymerase I-like protein with 3'-5' exonuclease and polymerase domains